MSDNEQFSPVTSDKDRQVIFDTLTHKLPQMVAWTEDQGQLLIKGEEISSLKIKARIIPNTLNAKIKNGDELQVLFGLDDGFYLIRAKIDHVLGGDLLLALQNGTPIFRMQRRENFRVAIPRGMANINFGLVAYNHKIQGNWTLAVSDLSAGGLRAKWVFDGTLPRPVVGDALTGVLNLPEGKQI